MKIVFNALFMYCYLCKLIQQVWSMKDLFIGYKLEKSTFFVAKYRIIVYCNYT